MLKLRPIIPLAPHSYIINIIIGFQIFYARRSIPVFPPSSVTVYTYTIGLRLIIAISDDKNNNNNNDEYNIMRYGHSGIVKIVYVCRQIDA